MMKRYFSQMAEKHSKEIPNKIAYHFMDLSVTWKEYHEDINRMTNSFIQLGLKKGDKVATLLTQSPAFMNVFMAAANMGLILVPLDPRFTSSEMASLCNRTNPKLLVCLANQESIVNTVESLLKLVDIPHVYSYQGSLPNREVKPYETLFDSSSEEISKECHPSLDDPLIIIFTSGSTGVPKGALITHRNTFAMAEKTVQTWKFTDDDKILINLPTSHVGGTHDMLAVQIYIGMTGILTPSFIPSETLRFIGKHQITFMGGVPTMFRLIFQQCNIAEYDVNSLRLVFLGGEPSSPQLIHRIKESFPNASVVASWGMTETSGYFTFSDIDDEVNIVAQTEGKPGPENLMKVIRPDGTRANTNEVGELYVKGESVISSYLDQKHNLDAFFDGWLKTGDLGYLDENDYLHFVGRQKEMFISGGYNVYPLEIESYLNTFPGINASCLIEVPDEIWGEVGVAFIVPEVGAALNVEEILNYCKQGLANYKIPKKFFIQTNLPKTLVGKIAKQEIRKSLDTFMVL